MNIKKKLPKKQQRHTFVLLTKLKYMKCLNHRYMPKRLFDYFDLIQYLTLDSLLKMKMIWYNL
jgi:hypothetical protein